jgi:pimeloyl-ACP methyl ester carboxylesterase
MSGREQFETVAGCKVRLLRGGKGAPLLYLHGAGGGGIWLPFMEKLAERFEVFAPEHPGFGASETPDWLDNVGDLAFYYLDFIDKLGLKNVTLVGSSIGGWTAAEIAVRSCASLKAMKFYFLHLMPYAALDLDYDKNHNSAWITLPNSYYDPKKGAKLYNRYLDELEYADQLGFDGVCVNEHHQNAYGLMPQPGVMAGALARRTKNVKIAVLGRALPLLNNPSPWPKNSP